MFKLLGNLFLYPFSHVVELWPGRPVGKGNGLSVCFLRGSGFIFFAQRLGEDPNKLKAFARTGLDAPAIVVLAQCFILAKHVAMPTIWA